MQQTFPAGVAQRIVIEDVDHDLVVTGWDQQIITVTSNADIDRVQPEGDTLIIRGCEDTLELAVPYETIIVAGKVDGHASVTNVRQVELRVVDGNVRLKAIAGDAKLGKVDGHLIASDIPTLSVSGKVGANAELTNIATVELGKVGTELRLYHVDAVSFGRVGSGLNGQQVVNVRGGSVGSSVSITGNRDSSVILGNIGDSLRVQGLARLEAQHVGNSCEVRESQAAEITLGHIGNSLDIVGARQVQAGKVGNRCNLRDISEDVTLGNVGADAVINSIGGNLQLGKVGGSAHLLDVHGAVAGGIIGGNLHLQADLPPQHVARLSVGGNAYVRLPDSPNLTIQAMAGGAVRGRGVASNAGHRAILVYGDGAARLDISAGGNLELDGNAVPQSSSSDWTPGGSSFGQEMAEFGREMAEFGREMGRLGQEMGASISASIGAEITDELARAAEKQRRKLEEQQRKLEEQRRRTQEHVWQANRQREARFNARIRDREWRMDPERINRIIEQAQQAAAEGIQGAAEAVEQALRNLNFAPPPKPPTPPSAPERPPVPPTPDHVAPPAPPIAPLPGSVVPPVPSVAPFSGSGPEIAPFGPSDADRDMNVDVDESESLQEGEEFTAEHSASAVNIEQEREAILRMIAEGRITPEEGDMLLEALG